MPTTYENTPVTDMLEYLRVEIESNVESAIELSMLRKRNDKAESELVQLKNKLAQSQKDLSAAVKECENRKALILEKNRINEELLRTIEDLRQRLEDAPKDGYLNIP